MSLALINGQLSECINWSDRGLQYGDGLFETISCPRGHPRWLTLHLERLQRGLARLRIDFAGIDNLREEIEQVAATGAEDCLVKAVVSRGPATRRGYAPAGDEQPTRIVSRHPWPAAQSPASAGFRVGISAVRLGTNPLLAGLKHLNRLEQVMAQMECAERELSEVLMLTGTGQVISGSMSNVFFVIGPGLVTPDLQLCGVEGVMRRVVLQAAARIGVSVQIRAVEPTELAGVSEAFATNVRLGIQSVHWLDGRDLLNEEWAQRLRRSINADFR
jgi:4-amino-4-deoxychorismate lyase